MTIEHAPVPTVFHAIGLQRTGTNYVTELVRLNLTPNVIRTGDRSICWKHALPRDRTPAGVSAAEAVAARPDVLVCLVAKHPLHWMASVTLRDPQDLFLKRTALLTDGAPDVAATARFYNRFYRAWLDVLGHRGGFAVVRYEDALRDPRQALAPIAAALATRVPAQVSVPERVPYSRAVPDARKAAYLTSRHGLGEEAVRIVDASVDDALLGALGYCRMPAAAPAVVG